MVPIQPQGSANQLHPWLERQLASGVEQGTIQPGEGGDVFQLSTICLQDTLTSLAYKYRCQCRLRLWIEQQSTSNHG